MPLQCPQCQSSILAQQIDQQFQATCPQCNSVFNAAAQLADLLAYQHPKKIEAVPANIDEAYINGILEITLGRFRKWWQRYLAWGGCVLAFILLLSVTPIIQEEAPSRVEASIFLSFFSLLVLSFLLACWVEFSRRIIITATKSYLAIFISETSDTKLNRQWATQDIKQLYLRKSSLAFPSLSGTKVYYELWILLQGGQTGALIIHIKDWPTALYLEQRLEAILHLKDQSVEGELDYLSPDEHRQLLEWGTLAERLNLSFIPGPVGGYYESDYPNKTNDDQHLLFRLDAFHHHYGEKFVNYTRLQLIKANLAPSPLSPEEEAELKNRLAVNEPVELLMPPNMLKELKGTLEIRAEEGTIYYEQTGIETNLAYLEKLFELMSYLAEVYPKILAWGGAAVPTLRTIATQVPSLKGVARQLLQDIATETQTRLEKQAEHLLCPSCLQGCISHKIWLPSVEPLVYCGCRACRQSREFLIVKGPLVAVLDEQMPQPYNQQGENLYVNWLYYRHLFDFNEIHIRQATDEEVERFAIQVGNDTDPMRQPHYATMRCLVWSDAGLSENSMKILQRTFGQVEIKSQTRSELQKKAKTSGPRVSRLGSETEEKTAKDVQEI